MKRLKKLYSITEETAKLIKEIAQEQCVPESYALDNIVQNFYRMTHRNKKSDKEQSTQKWFDEYWKTYEDDKNKKH